MQIAPILIILLAIAVIVIYIVYDKRRKKARLIQTVREKWGKPTDDERNMSLIGLYKDPGPGEGAISDAMGEDIDIDQLFAFVDRTNSKPGQQYLYNRLHQPVYDAAALQQMDADATRLASDRDKQEQLEIELSKLNTKNAYYLPELFLKEQTPLFDTISTVYIQLSWLLMLSFITMLIVTKSPLGFVMILILAIVNMALHYKNKGKISQYTHSLPQVVILYQVAQQLFKHTEVKRSDKVAGSIANLKKLKGPLSFISFQNRIGGDPTDVLYAIIELIKTLFLLEGLMFIRSINRVKKYRKDIAEIYAYVGGIDMLIAISSVRLSLPYYCKPVFTDGDELKITDLYHPLITDCVANSITSSSDKGVLVTGSNMSGKTTFIRSIAINTLFAQTLFTCCAQEYRSPLLKLHTSVRVSDAIDKHKSYFQAEALSVLDILNQCGANEMIKGLVIIDEIFRGTNTIERIAAAKAVLSYLTANHNFVFVSTHDLELAELLGNDYVVYSFEESVADKRLVFDYKLKQGLLKNKNGIAVLQSVGFPDTVIADAYRVSEELRRKYQI